MNTSLRPIIAAIQSTSVPASGKGESSLQEGAAAPFVTISRQAGAGGHSLAANLAHRLNSLTPERPAWHSYDRELVEKIAADHQVSQSILESFEDSSHNWLKDIVTGLSFTAPRSGELALYRKVAATIATLARIGHAIIVGRGGVFITHDMPGGIHVLVVAPLEYRVRMLALERGVSTHEAARLMRELDQNRQDFYRHYWPDTQHAPETFTVTLNSAGMTERQMVDVVLALIPRRKYASDLADAVPL